MTKSIAERFNVNVSGSQSKPMMFAHGLGCDQSMWRFITPSFVQEHKIILFDYLGSGASDIESYEKEKYNSLEVYADDIIEIIQSLNEKEVIFVGHSVGAMIGMLAAIKAPELFQNVIMVGPSPCYINHPGYGGGFDKKEIDKLLKQMKDNLYKWSKKFAPVIMGNEERPALSEELEDSFMSSDHEILYHFAELTFKSDLRFQVPQLKTPALIMQCNDDIIAPEEVGDFLHKTIPASKLVKMKATGHCAHLSEPHETISLIKEYLGEQ